MSNFEMRPHHGLCIPFFRGHGYNDAFVANMKNIIAQLKDNPEITLVSRSDCLCSHCPNAVGTNCTCDDKVSRYDNAVLELCQFSFGTTLFWDDFSKEVSRSILEKGLLPTVCGDCQWSSYCTL